MSRFAQDVEVGLRQIADRATPSPDAWNSILTRIADEDPIHETEIIMLTDNTLTTRRWPKFAAAAAVAALLVGGIALIARDDGPEAPAVPPSPTTPEVLPTPEPEAETSTDGAVMEIPAEGAAMPPGTYSTVKPFGMPVTFEVPAGTEWTVGLKAPNGLGFGPKEGFVAMTRFGSFYDAEQAIDPDMNGVGSIPPDDMDAWIEANGIIVDDSAEGTIGGRSAIFRQIRLPEGMGDGLCPPAVQPCIKMGSHSADLTLRYVHQIDGELPNAYWFVEMDEFEPFGIWVWTSEVGGMETFLDQLAPLFDSIVFGDPAPTVEGGTARLPERIAATGNMTVTQTGERDVNEPWPIERVGVIVGDINGTFTGTGISSPNGAEVTLDWVMDVTVDGLGTGTLTLRSDEVWTGDAARTAADRVIAGTGDFEGVTGFGTTTHTDDGATYTATIELMLAPPAN